MRKSLVSACLAIGLLVSGVLAPTAKADHGYRGVYGAGYGAPSCHSHYSGYGSGYGQHYGGYGGHVVRYQTAIVPVYPGGIYQSYSFGGSPFGYSNYGQIGSPFGAGYGSSFYGSGYRSSVPRVQLRIGF